MLGLGLVHEMEWKVAPKDGSGQGLGIGAGTIQGGSTGGGAECPRLNENFSNRGFSLPIAPPSFVSLLSQKFQFQAFAFFVTIHRFRLWDKLNG